MIKRLINYKFSIQISYFIGILLVLFTAGWELGKVDIASDVLWNKESEGLRDLANHIKGDKSKRLGILLFTEKSVYTVSALGNGNYRLLGGIFHNPEVKSTDKGLEGFKMILGNLPQ